MSRPGVIAPNATEYVDCEATVDAPDPFDRNVLGYAECGFAGDVEIEVVAECGFIRTVAWTCPSCTTAHVEDRDAREEG